jgi:glycosyltransferase involved in cell wall biosynthesis
MTAREFFILVPALSPTGPVKGAIALANALVGRRTVTLVSIRGGGDAQTPIDPRVALVSLATHRSMRSARYEYCRMLRDAGGRSRAVSISMCFSADRLNLGCRDHAVTCASVRGNLIENYRFDYGLPGIGLALGHLIGLRGFDHVVAMTNAMARQVGMFTRGTAHVVGNFVDELPLEHARRQVATGTDELHFAFVGSLSARKRPLQLLGAIDALLQRGVRARVSFLGDGPLRGQVEREVARRGLESSTDVLGHVPDPAAIIAGAHAFVLPSLSEGLSRAALEALYLGVPCVLRRVDGNSELIHSEHNGCLFERDEDLPDALLQAAHLSSRQPSGVPRPILLPESFRQQNAVKHLMDCLEVA